MKKVATRFAPSPTGPLHIGGVRTALFNWLYSKNKKGDFYLRVEDTDKERSKDEYKNQIIKSLKWIGINYDGEEYIQSKKIEDHIKVANQLLNNGFASGDQHIFGAKSITNSARFMFDTIKIHNRDTAQGGRTFVLFNCMIQNINHDTLNYADSGPILYNVQFIPEHFNITNLQKELDEEKVSENTAIGGNLAGVVANRPDIIEPLPNLN